LRCFKNQIRSVLATTLSSCCLFVCTQNLTSASNLPNPTTGLSKGKPTMDTNTQIKVDQKCTDQKHTDEHRAPFVEKYLLEGKLAEGEAASIAFLEKHPKDDQARFGLGALQFLQSVEHLAQNLYRFGLRNQAERGFNFPFLRIQIPTNPKPETISYQQCREIFDTFRKGLVKAESTLALINDPDLKLPLHFKIIRLDLNGDGIPDDKETLWKVYADLTNNKDVDEKEANDFLICFDRGDVHWLRGYCHLLSGICEVYLAHDSRETFECTGHLLFAKTNSPYKFLTGSKHVRAIGRGDMDIADLVEFIHSIRWSVAEPERMRRALHHFEAVVAQSHESWKWIMAETDDDHEWLPNPRQTGVIPNVRVTQEMVDAWTDIMNEFDKLLSGKLLIPFWRGDERYGVNVRKVFLAPTTLDVVLWVQGPAAAPYLEKGPLTEGKLWNRSRQVFGHNFPGFAIWFN
jgi:hypothetical protein